MSNVTTQASDALTGGLTAVGKTLAELREQRLAWERDVTVLFDDFDSLAVRFTLESSVGDRQPIKSVSDECWRELAGKNESLARQQETATQELSTMRELITQQTELLTAFIGAATQFSEPARPVTATTDSDPVINAVKAEFAQCQSSVHESRLGTSRSAVVQSN